MNRSAVIMAGGRGERFWPKSRKALPKQFLCLSGDNKSMLRHTVERIFGLVNFENMFVVTNKDYKELVAQHIPELPLENIILEPEGRNTAPCIAIAACAAEKKCGDTVMFVLPSDHMISNLDNFVSVLGTAANKASKEHCLVTLGIMPEYPETGYGYINFDADSMRDGCCRVKRFVEKPDKTTAEKYLTEGTYLWNSGMFIWQTSVIIDKFKTLMPETYQIARRIQEDYLTDNFENTLNVEFPKMPSESVDYGIMEKSSDIYTVPSSFGWDDVGSWLAVEHINKLDQNQNVIDGECETFDTHNSVILGGKRLVAAVGLEDIIIVDTDDVLLVCRKSHAQDVKSVLAQLKKQNKLKYL